MRTMVAVVTAASVVTAAGVVWLCARFESCAKRFFVEFATSMMTAGERAAEEASSLLRIEEAAAEAREASTRVAAKVEVATQLGFQTAAAARRMETGDAHVAGDLASSIARADALPQDGNFGAAADAALRSPEDDTA